MPSVSVIIPTHKRAAILRECLQRLDDQTIRGELEIIVVSDGHDDATAAMFMEPQKGIHFLEIEKSQQGVARNRGVEIASAPLCLFIGDDIFLDDDACEIHRDAHLAYPEAISVLGFTTWDPTLTVNPLMMWLEKSGWQFGYAHLQKFADQFVPKNIQHFYTYSSHISVPTEVAKRISFREDVSGYGWEDTEWGKRLATMGIKLLYEPDAYAVHHHHMTLEDSLLRVERIGESLHQYPELDLLPSGLKLLAYHIQALLPTLSGKHRKAFLRGLKKGTVLH